MTLHKTADSPPQAPLWGLVLAGGESERMGEDKGLLDYHGLPQVVRVRLQLQEFCQQVFVSMNATQARSAPYATLQKIVDHEPRRGPASGLLSAWNAFPMTAWLVVAVDLPFLDRETLQALVAGRDSTLLATAFQHPDGPLEPLCAIWEPWARPVVAESFAAGQGSLRRVLEENEITVLEPPKPEALRGVDAPAERHIARQALDPPGERGAALGGSRGRQSGLAQAPGARILHPHNNYQDDPPV